MFLPSEDKNGRLTGESTWWGEGGFKKIQDGSHKNVIKAPPPF